MITEQLFSENVFSSFKDFASIKIQSNYFKYVFSTATSPFPFASFQRALPFSVIKEGITNYDFFFTTDGKWLLKVYFEEN